MTACSTISMLMNCQQFELRTVLSYLTSCGLYSPSKWSMSNLFPKFNLNNLFHNADFSTRIEVSSNVTLRIPNTFGKIWMIWSHLQRHMENVAYFQCMARMIWRMRIWEHCWLCRRIASCCTIGETCKFFVM